MLSDLDKALGHHLLAGANQLRRFTYWLYEKTDDLHYFLDQWDRTLHTEQGPWSAGDYWVEINSKETPA